VDNSWLISATVFGILLLLFLVIRLRLAAFVALLLVSVIVGLGANMPGPEIVNSIRNGMGGTLGFVAVVVGLGAILGQLLEASGGVQRVAQTIIGKFGADRAQWGLGATGFIIAIPVFFDVALIILIPLVYGLAQGTGLEIIDLDARLGAAGDDPEHSAADAAEAVDGDLHAPASFMAFMRSRVCTIRAV